MANIVPIVCACVFLVGILILISAISVPQKQSALQNVYNDIAFPTGDHIIFYQQAQQVVANAAQLATSPSSPLKLLGIDSHNNVIAQNTTSNQIVNASAGTPQAQQILAIASTTTNTNGGTYLSTTGSTYNAGSTITSPTKSTTCTRGHTCTIAGKIIIVDSTKCSIQTVNGVQQKVCQNLLGPFKYTIQIICVDSDPYRCSFLAGVLPTFRGETPDGTFSYNWTPQSDAYYVGNYIARLYTESEPATINGPTVSETGDYPITVYQ